MKTRSTGGLAAGSACGSIAPASSFLTCSPRSVTCSTRRFTGQPLKFGDHNLTNAIPIEPVRIGDLLAVIPRMQLLRIGLYNCVGDARSVQLRRDHGKPAADFGQSTGRGAD